MTRRGRFHSFAAAPDRHTSRRRQTVPAGLLDGGVRGTPLEPSPPSFSSVIRGRVHDGRRPVFPWRWPGDPAPTFDDHLRRRAHGLQTRDIADAILIVPEHVARALGGVEQATGDDDA